MGETLQIGSHLRKCTESELNDTIFELVNIDKNNSNFTIKVSNDSNHIFCPLGNDSCEIEIEDGDRFSATTFQYVINPEYIGFKGGHSKNNKYVSLSLLKRSNIVKKDAKGQLQDNSLWEYKLPKMKLKNSFSIKNTIEPFFDNNELTKQKPQPPEHINSVDLDVLRACGPIRGKVTKKEFNSFIDKHFNALKPTFPDEWEGLRTLKLKNDFHKYGWSTMLSIIFFVENGNKDQFKGFIIGQDTYNYN